MQAGNLLLLLELRKKDFPGYLAVVIIGCDI